MTDRDLTQCLVSRVTGHVVLPRFHFSPTAFIKQWHRLYRARLAEETACYTVTVDSNPAERVPQSVRIRSLILEGLKLFGIALAALVVIAVAIFVSIKTGITIPKRWFGFCVWTGLLIWFVQRLCKHHRRNSKFWLAFGGLLVVHISVFVVVLRSITAWGLGWFAPVFIVEAPIMVVLLEAVVARKPSSGSPHTAL